MAVIKKDELMNRIKEKIGNDNSDETLALIEDISDTIDESEKNDWKSKFDENDKMWREKYKNRFFSTPVEDEKKEDKKMNDDESEMDSKSYDKLFKEEKK